MEESYIIYYSKKMNVRKNKQKMSKKHAVRRARGDAHTQTNHPWCLGMRLGGLGGGGGGGGRRTWNCCMAG